MTERGKGGVAVCFYPVDELAAARKPANVTEAWMRHPSVCRLLRAAGVEEALLTGNGADFERFEALMTHLAPLRGTPIFEALSLELETLGGTLPPSGENAAALWQAICRDLGGALPCPWENERREGGCLLVPVAPGEWDAFSEIRQNGSEKSSILPLFYPDSILGIDRVGFADRIAALGGVTGLAISDLEGLTLALRQLLDRAEQVGAPGALHRELLEGTYRRPDPYHAGEVLRRGMERNGRGITAEEKGLFNAQILRMLGREYEARRMRVILAPPASGRVDEGVAVEDGAQKSCSVCGANGNDGFCSLVEYLAESGALPPAIVVLSPETPLRLLKRLGGRFPARDGAPRLLWGIDGRCAGGRDLARMTATVVREVSLGGFAGLVFADEGFLTAPTRRMFETHFLDLLCQWGEKNPDLVQDALRRRVESFWGLAEK